MYILKNAWTSIKRNKGRNILIGVIVLVISLTSTVALAIYNSSNKLIESYEDSYEVTGTIGINRESLMKNFKPGEDNMDEVKENYNNIESLTEDQIEKFADSKYVKSYYYTSSIGVNGSSIEAATSEKKFDMPDRKQSQSDFTLTGYNSLEAMSEFIEGKYKITDGEINTDFDADSCVINKELATLNDLSVGDEITLTLPNDESKTYALKITGIFEEKDSEEASQGRMDMFSNSANNIITNINVLNKIFALDEDITVQTTPTFVLTSKDIVDDFEKELSDKGLNEYLTLNTNLDEVENSTKSISNVKTFAITFLIITLIIGGVVLFIINMINVRERKYEIGVLRTIGMKKSKVSLQFMIELIMISVVTLGIGTGIGAGISKPVANKMLENEIQNSTQSKEEINKNFGGMEKSDMNNGMPDKINGVVSVDEIDSINAIVDYKVILELLGIGTLLTIISSSAAMLAIQRFSPLTILKERS